LLFVIYYIFAISIILLHFTGHLAAWGIEWIVYVLLVTVFPAVLFL